MTSTLRLEANTSWQAAATGPQRLVINPELKFSQLYIGNTAPDANTTAIFTLKPIAGENFLDVEIGTGDTLYIRSLQESSVISMIASPLTVS